MWLNQSTGSFEVVDVIADSPAASAGLRTGDKIQAIDGQTADQLSLAEIRHRFKSEPAGTKLHLTVQSGEQKRDVDLTLKDLV
jgi:carboxyl-terminal processing protease